VAYVLTLSFFKTGMILFSYLTDFVGEKSERCRARRELVKDGGLERGEGRWFQLFSVILFANQNPPCLN
jgi:hypothetical protein